MLKYIALLVLVLGLNAKAQSFPNIDDMYFDWTSFPSMGYSGPVVTSLVWEAVAGLPSVRTSGAMFEYSNTLWHIGGATAGIPLSNSLYFTGSSWASGPNSPALLADPTVAKYNGLVYVHTGTNMLTFNGTSFSRVASFPAFRDLGAFDVVNDTLYYLGGDGSNIYRLNGSTWVTETINLYKRPFYSGGGTLNGKIHYPYNYDVNIANYATNTITWDGTNIVHIASDGYNRVHYTPVVVKGSIYGIAGNTPAGSANRTNVVTRYNGTNWTVETPLPIKAYYVTTAAFGDYIYTAGGNVTGTAGVTNVFRAKAIGTPL